MTIDPDIRDQAYQFFIEEASELLDIIETGLLNLRPDVNVQKVHEIMRAAHSIKGGAASVDLDTIKTIAHRLEDAFKALYSDTLVVDAGLETLLLRAYDCLRHPLQSQINTGEFNEKQALAVFDVIFGELEERLGPAMGAADSFMPSAVDLGVDIVASIFEVDVANVLTHLQDILENPDGYNCGEELQTQLEILTSFAELVEVPGFTLIMVTAQSAANQHSHQPLLIIEQVLGDINNARTAILAGTKEAVKGPSAMLLALAEGTIAGPDEPTQSDVPNPDVIKDFELAELDLAALDASVNDGLSSEMESLAVAADQVSTLEEIWSIDAVEFPSVERIDELEDSTVISPDLASLEDVWGHADAGEAALDVEVNDFEAVMEEGPSAPLIENWSELPPDLTMTAELINGAPDISGVEQLKLEGEESHPTLQDIASFVEHGSDPSPDLDMAAELINDAPDVSGVEPLEIEGEGNYPNLQDVASFVEDGSDSSPDLDMVAELINDAPDVSSVKPLKVETTEKTPDFQDAVTFVNDVYESLPRFSVEQDDAPVNFSPKELKPKPKAVSNPKKLSAKVALARLERMDNLVGELAINRNSLSLHNDQFQRTVRRLGQRFSSFRTIVKQLQSLSDQILISPERQLAGSAPTSTAFDSLEMDSYGEINLLLEEVLEEVFQLSESIDDVALFAGQSNQSLESQRRTLTQLRDELMWSRMVPLDRVLKHFPRVIWALSMNLQKPVQLKLIGTDVLVDRVMLEKLYDPLLHLLRNAFDHGIEMPEKRQALGKPAEGTIEIRAYHQGSYTVIEIADDGQGLDMDKIIERAIAVQLVSPEQIEAMPNRQIQHLIFEPGFSTASKVSEISGRGVGLDVVKESLQTFNGKLSLTTNRGKGTVFSLKIPLTLTLTKLVVGSVGKTSVALASDSIEEILRPTTNQLKYSGGKQFLHWRNQLIPAYDLAELLSYQCRISGQLPRELQEGQIVHGQNTMLILQQGQERLALSLERIVTEQELVVKPVGKAIAAPDYINGCTVLADGSLVPVIDGAALVQFDAGPATPIVPQPQLENTKTLMIVDDSSALRRTLALTLRKAGYQVLQAKDGRDAVEQLQRGALPDLIICDVEMPRLNGFEFLSQRRANLEWAKIPTVMLTSRGNHKHQTLAKHLGATAYFTKPYIEKEFVGAIATLLEKSP